MRLESSTLLAIQRSERVRSHDVVEFVFGRHGLQSTAQRRHRASNPRLDRAQRHTGPGCDFRMRQTFVERQLDERALRVGKRSQRSSHAADVLCRHGDLFRAPPGRRNLRHRDRLAGTLVGPCISRSETVDRARAGEHHHPASDRGTSPLIPARFSPDLSKYVLDHLLGIFQAMEYPSRETKNHPGVPVVETRERIARSGSYIPHQPLVGVRPLDSVGGPLVQGATRVLRAGKRSGCVGAQACTVYRPAIETSALTGPSRPACARE